MNEDPTQNLPDARSFEERVFARFDALDARLVAVETRLQALEDQAERRALETKPMWERALAEILELRQSFINVERKIDVLSRDVMQVRADQLRLDNRLDQIEGSPTR